ncbi:MAG: hypothetical protein KDK39_15020 [Leptospiraceae bacterium]|nr:hypothetical protein [Leptospiraceae bacterium]
MSRLRYLINPMILFGLTGTIAACQPLQPVADPLQGLTTKSLFFDMQDCSIREDGYMVKKQSIHLTGKTTPMGDTKLCTVYVSKAAFEQSFLTCSLSGYGLEPGAGSSDAEQIYTRPRFCGFRHLDTRSQYVFEARGPGACSFACLTRP